MAGSIWWRHQPAGTSNVYVYYYAQVYRWSGMRWIEQTPEMGEAKATSICKNYPEAQRSPVGNTVYDSRRNYDECFLRGDFKIHYPSQSDMQKKGVWPYYFAYVWVLDLGGNWVPVGSDQNF
jgi:hypothetical protein